MKFWKFLITSLLTVGIAIAFSAFAGQASVVDFPADYQTKFFQYATVDCPKSQIVRKMYVNREVVNTIKTRKIVPSTTVIAMETHSARIGSNGHLMPNQLNNVFVREKQTGWRVSNDSGEWQSAWYSPSGNLVSSSQGSCISCHTMVRDRDYLFTLPALLKAANTGQIQYQKTEFGTSVCQ
ncbi:cytochrome P460 family protein [Candidatus Gracilibacteria bacterium]|jgi:Cytochrome P460|nr:cytochrome P460 family protein [Candidatus Gracilibacteria bacterium]NJM89175.1 cytochrome P460 family protein [Hydrococcus sp. RU_2_2]NJP21983.1 cytochrome P460 family protein [Hydrococcus sp. CRU_1_1]